MNKNIIYASLIIVILLASTILITAQDDPTEPIAIWHFDEGSGTIAYDSSGNGNHGTIVNGNWHTGIFNNSLEFDGTGNIILDEIINLGDEWTVSYWIKMYSYNSVSNAIIGYNGCEYITEIWSNTKSVTTANTNSGNCWSKSLSNNWTDGNWYNVIITMNQGIATYYINGINNTLDSYYGGCDARIRAIAGHGSSVSWFKGLIDEVAIYNYALTHNEVKEIACVLSDADNDGVITLADYTYVQVYFGRPTEIRAEIAELEAELELALQGDFNNDGFVDILDYYIWQSEIGQY